MKKKILQNLVKRLNQITIKKILLIFNVPIMIKKEVLLTKY